MGDFSFGFWDAFLLVAVACQATVLAYLPAPRWKAFILTLPVPFSIATLALGEPVNVTALGGLIALLFYTHGVRLLHTKWGVPVIAAIVLCAGGYCVLGAVLAAVLPRGPMMFWSVFGLLVVAGGLLYATTPHRHEPAHRTPLPVYVKLPIVMAVVFLLIVIKRRLEGFMTTFPMVGVLAAYEARHSLWTISRQIPVIMLTIGPMIALMRLLQAHIGLGASLALAWILFIVLLAPLTWGLNRGASKATEETAHGL